MSQRRTVFLGMGIILLTGVCLLAGFTLLGSGVTLWLWEDVTNTPTPRPTPKMVAIPPALTPTPTLIPLPTSTPTPSPPPTPTSTLVVPPSPTFTATVLPTETPSPAPAPPTATPLPTDTPAPVFSFIVAEVQGFPTNHLNFDVYIAITDTDNKPLSGYRVLGQHSGGLQVDSQVSAGEWTQNSGAKHYKAGNIKFEVFTSPGGVWTLQLVNPDGQPAAPPLEFPFDPNNPSWYFVLYRLAE